MSIGATIKALRRGVDMTQETLAEHLSVSPQAVSRWETDAALPDITLLAPMANLFGVTTDHLLGVDVEKKKEKIREIRDSANEKGRRGYPAEAREILSAGLKQFPGDYGLMNDLGSILWQLSRDDACTEEERETLRNASITLKEKVLEGCTDNSLRNSAVQTLCFLYSEVGKKERAVELANSMPIMCLVAGICGRVMRE